MIAREEIDKLLGAVALSVASRPVKHEMVLRTILEHRDHHAPDELGELAEQARVCGYNGVALIMRKNDWPHGVQPPTWHLRSRGNYDVLFYREQEKRPYQDVDNDEHVRAACAAACARWGEPTDRATVYPWGYLHSPHRYTLEAKTKAATDPVTFHAQSFARGYTYGVTAVAAGRLGPSVLAIQTTRWLFPREGVRP